MSGPVHEIQPIHIRDKAEQKYNPLGGGGGYSGSGSGWGLTEGPRRGEGNGPTRHEPVGPFVMDDLMNEQKEFQRHIDNEYNAIFNNLYNQTRNEIENLKNNARSYTGSSVSTSARSDQEVTLNTLNSKNSDYHNHITGAFTVWAQSLFPDERTAFQKSPRGLSYPFGKPSSGTERCLRRN